jgi:hypothetical protein
LCIPVAQGSIDLLAAKWIPTPFSEKLAQLASV